MFSVGANDVRVSELSNVRVGNVRVMEGSVYRYLHATAEAECLWTVAREELG